MNQQTIKNLLLKLKSDVPDFTVTFTGKESKKVDGLYKTESREILIHNKNHKTDNAIKYTAIHEFAHHVHFCSDKAPKSAKSHTGEFWSIFHNLLYKAEDLNLYDREYDKIPELVELTKELKQSYISQNGQLMVEMGKKLLNAFNICQEYHLSFEDYLDRQLGIQKTNAKSIMKISTLNLDPKIGFDNMKTLAGIRNPEQRQLAQNQMKQGKTAVMITSDLKTEKTAMDPLEENEKNKKRLLKKIQALKMELVNVEMEIERLKEEQLHGN
ncbi:hypothetical protein [Spirochaeta cellobiosiphila]|uniref:hypothetical protein n=1 Tax=Spirochaeta cellobiosiphila TaxID=504483 RepID=UPI0003F95748|nr:hypothetical protein [Spirochaeta cellobiosiphila]